MEISLFPKSFTIIHRRFIFVGRLLITTLYVSFLPDDGIFLRCDHGGLDFDISFYERIQPKSINRKQSMGMSRLTRDGTAEPVSRDQILRHARGQGNIIFPVQLTTSRIGNLIRLIHTLLYVMTIHTCIHMLAW